MLHLVYLHRIYHISHFSIPLMCTSHPSSTSCGSLLIQSFAISNSSQSGKVSPQFGLIKRSKKIFSSELSSVSLMVFFTFVCRSNSLDILLEIVTLFLIGRNLTFCGWITKKIQSVYSHSRLMQYDSIKQWAQV